MSLALDTSIGKCQWTTAYLDGSQNIIGRDSLPSILSGEIIGTGCEVNDEDARRTGKRCGSVLADICRCG